MLDFYLAASIDRATEESARPRLSLGGGQYWFLHRYFVHACLKPGDFSFLNPYEDTEVSGYQLHRLGVELQEATADLSARPDNFNVLVGWHGTNRSVETEDWCSVDRTELLKATEQLLRLVTEAHRSGLCIIAIGD